MSDKPDQLQFEDNIAMYQYIQMLLKFCIENKVDIIANQKVVDTEFVEIFREKGILVLPRLGTKGIQSLQKLLRLPKIIKSIGELQNPQNRQNPSSIIQSLDELYLEILDNKTYLSFKKSKANHCTIIVTQWNQEFCPEFEFLCQRTQDLLFQLIKNPFVLPGAGCIETILYNAIPKDKATNGLCKGLLNLISSILQEKLVLLELETDLDFGHLWIIKDSQCQCKMLKRSETQKFTHFPHENQLKLKPAQVPEKQRIILDHYKSKLTMLATSIEASEGLSKVGKILYL